MPNGGDGGYGFQQAYYPSSEMAEDDPWQTWQQESSDWDEGAESSLDFDEPLLGQQGYPPNTVFSARRVARAFDKAQDRFERLEAQVNALARRDRRTIERLREQVNELSNDALMGTLLNQVTQETETISDSASVRHEVLVPPSGINRIIGLLPGLMSSRGGGSGGRNNLLPLVLVLALGDKDNGDSEDQDRNLLLVLALTMMNR